MEPQVAQGVQPEQISHGVRGSLSCQNSGHLQSRKLEALGSLALVQFK